MEHGTLIECPKCHGPRPRSSTFCPQCGVDSEGFKRWLRRAIGGAIIGTLAACGVTTVDEIDPGVDDGGVDAGVDAGLDAGADAGVDAGVDAGPIIPPRCFYDAGYPVTDYGIVFFPDAGCEP